MRFLKNSLLAFARLLFTPLSFSGKAPSVESRKTARPSPDDGLPEIGIKGMVYPRPKPSEPDPPKRATPEEIAKVEAALNQKKFTHYLGKFSGMNVDIDNHILTLTPQDATPAKAVEQYRAAGKPIVSFHPPRDHICGYFTVEHANNVYVFWNNPSDAQKKIHNDLQKKIEARIKNGETVSSSHCDLTILPDGGNFRAHVVPVEIMENGRVRKTTRIERPVFTIINTDDENKPVYRKAEPLPPDADYLAPNLTIELREDWKPETGHADGAIRIKPVAPPAPPRTTICGTPLHANAIPGFYGPYLD